MPRPKTTPLFASITTTAGSETHGPRLFGLTSDGRVYWWDEKNNVWLRVQDKDDAVEEDDPITT